MKKVKLFVLPLVLILVSVACKQEPKTVEEEVVKEEVANIEQAPQALGYKIGDVATDFSLINIDNQKVSLADYTEAKGFIVIFTCNHCPYAVAYEDRIIGLDKKYKELGFPVIAINPNDPVKQPEDSFENMVIRAKQKGFTYPYLLDEGQEIYPQYGATKTPHVFVLQKMDGKNIVQYIGAIDDNYDDAAGVTEKYVENAVDALLAGDEVTVKETKAIGCTIKVK